MPDEEHSLEAAASRFNDLDRKLSELLRTKSVQSRWREIGIPLTSLVVALAGVITGAYMQIDNSQVQIELKKYEVTFSGKLNGYSTFNWDLKRAFDKSWSAAQGDSPSSEAYEAISKFQQTFYTIEPFLKDDKGQELLNEVETLSGVFLDMAHLQDSADEFIRDPETGKRIIPPKVLKPLMDTFIESRKKLRGKLRQELFGASPDNN